MMRKFLVGLMALCASLAWAAEPVQVAYDSAGKVAQHGPQNIELIDQAKLKLPAGYAFIPKKEAMDLMIAMGNTPGDDMLGLIMPTSEQENWFIDVSFEKSGFIKDDDAKEWNADELLTSLKEGTEQANEARKARGIPEFEVLGWVEKPTYEAGQHRLVWSANTQDKGAPKDAEQGVNYNTYALGREGYISMNLVTGMNTVEQEKPIAKELLGALEFNSGKRYEEFDANTDKIAEYGLAALVGGVAVKKLGFFALIAAFFAKSFKLIGLALVGAFYAIRKFFGRTS